MLSVDAQFCPDYCVYFCPFYYYLCISSWVSNLVLVFLFIYLFCQVFESLCVSYLFRVNCRFMSNCYLCLNVFSSNRVVSYCSMSLVLIFVHVKCHFILINHVF